jgi:hypothetical protein
VPVNHCEQTVAGSGKKCAIPFCLGLMLGGGPLRIPQLCSLFTHSAATEGAQMFSHKMLFASRRSKALG